MDWFAKFIIPVDEHREKIKMRRRLWRSNRGYSADIFFLETASSGLCLMIGFDLLSAGTFDILLEFCRTLLRSIIITPTYIQTDKSY